MKVNAKVGVLFAASIGLVACDINAVPAPPDKVLQQGMVEALLDTGFYADVTITRTIGRHFQPEQAAWKILACFQFNLPGGQQAETCVDSFEAYQLDNGTWVVAVTVDGLYRWRAIGSAGVSTGTPPTPTSPSPE